MDCIIKDNGFARKPSPQVIEFLIKKLNISKSEAIMIGDKILTFCRSKTQAFPHVSLTMIQARKLIMQTFT